MKGSVAAATTSSRSALDGLLRQCGTSVRSHENGIPVARVSTMYPHMQPETLNCKPKMPPAPLLQVIPRRPNPEFQPLTLNLKPETACPYFDAVSEEVEAFLRRWRAQRLRQSPALPTIKWRSAKIMDSESRVLGCILLESPSS